MKQTHPIAWLLAGIGGAIASIQFTYGATPSTSGNPPPANSGTPPPVNSVTPPPAKEETVLLSPFLVEDASDKGWRATNTISATRVNMPLVTVPQTISVLTTDFIKDVGAFDLNEAGQWVSSVGTTGFARGNFNVRGFAVGSSRRNGVTLSNQISPVTVNIDRVEFVKGPSSALYGVGQPGGVVNYVTKLPLEKRQTELTTAVDSEGSYRGSVDMTGPLTSDGRLLYRLIGLASHKVGTKQFDTMDEFFLEPTLRWFIRKGKNPTILTVAANWDRVPDSQNADERWPQIYELRNVPLPGNPNRMVNMGVAYAPGLPDDFNMCGPNSWRLKESTAIFADLQHAFNDHFTMRLSYADAQDHNNRTTQFPVFIAGSGQLTFETAANRTASISKTAFYADNDQWDRTLRLDFNYSQDFDWTKITATAGAERRTGSSDTKSFRDFNLPPFPLYNPQPSDYILPVYPSTYLPQSIQRNDTENDQYNLMVSGQFFKGRLTVLAGVSRTVQQYSKVDRADARSGGGAGPLFQINPNLKQPNNYAAGTTFEFLPGFYAFYSYSESSLAPSVNFPNNPQTGTGTDFGIRAQKGRFSGAITVFDVKRTNIVRSDPTQPTGSPNFQVLSGAEESTGWEVELFYFPTDSLQIVANYTDMKPIVVSNISAPITEGRTIDGAYPNTFNLFARYAPRKGMLEGWYFSGGLNYYSKTLPFGTNETLTFLENPSYTLFQAGFGYQWKWESGLWNAGITVNNIGDKFYWNDAAKNGQLRLITGTLTWRF